LVEEKTSIGTPEPRYNRDLGDVQPMADPTPSGCA
jgi:hypothetical protein